MARGDAVADERRAAGRSPQRNIVYGMHAVAAVLARSPERVLELVRSEGPKMGKVLKAAGVEPD